MRLTVGMLNAMMYALNEMLAGEGPQGFDEDSDESQEVMRNADKAANWVGEELARREERKHEKTL